MDPSGQKASHRWRFFFFQNLFVCLFLRGRVVVTSAVCHVSSWGENRGAWVVAWSSIPMCPDEWSDPHTCGKPLLVERKSVSAALKFHINPWQGGPLVQKLHCQSGGVGGAVWKFKLGPQGPGTWRKTQTLRSNLQLVALISHHQQQGQQNANLPSFSDFSEMSLNFHKHLLCSELLEWKRRKPQCSSVTEQQNHVQAAVLVLLLCILPDGGRQGLHAGDASVNRH